MPTNNKKRLLAAGLAALALAGGFFAYRKARSLYGALMEAVSAGREEARQGSEDTVYWVQRGVNELDSLIRAYGAGSRYTFDYSWADTAAAPLIAHAMGGVDGRAYTNSLEAFEANYALGHRIFEVDLDLTEDDYTLIACHYEDRWRQDTGAPEDMPYTAENIRSQWARLGYTAPDYRELVALLAQYPDICLVTDTKYDSPPEIALQFSQLVKYAQETAPETLERIVPQIYNMDMLDRVMDIYPFRSVIFTLYNTYWTPETVRLFCENTNVGMVAVSQAQYTQELADALAQAGVRLAVHTVNEPQEAQALLESGIDMLYTDFLPPADFSG